MRQSTVLSAALLTFFIAGCKQADAPPAVSEPAITKANLVLSVDPAEMPACDKKPRTATLRWDATAVADLSAPYEIWVSYPSKEPRLFARSPVKKGQVQTGRWIIAGASFSLKNSNGSEIANVEVAGVPCD